MPGMRYQPQGLARVASAGIASGMVFSVQGGTGLRDVVRGLQSNARAPGANHAVRAFPGGLAFDCRGLAAGGFVSIPGEAGQLASDQSLVLDIIIAGAPTGSVPAIGGIWRSGTQDDAQLVVERSSADAIQVRFRIGGAGATRVFNVGASTLYGRRITLAVSILRGLGRSIFLRVAASGQVIFDQEVSYTTSGSSDITPTGAEYISVGSEQIENPSRDPNCIIYAQHHFSRALSADEVASLSRAPWQVYQAPEDEAVESPAIERRLSVGPTGLSLGGGQVSMRVSRRLHAAPAALAVSAAQVALRVARRMSVQPVSLAVLARPARMLTSRRFGVQPAALAVAGQGVAIRAGRRLRVSPVVLGATGNQVGMQYAPAPLPGSYTLPVSAAVTTLDGGAVGMRVTRRLPVAGIHIRVDTADMQFHLRRVSGSIDMSWVSLSRIVRFESSGSRLVIFEGSGSRVVVFEGSGKRVRFNQMSAKVPTKVGEKWTVDRDRDEISYYAADITDELADRNTTAIEESVSAPVYGVELLEGPELQVATVDGVERTFVVVKLGGVDVEPGEEWRWVARVLCANGERFDKTTWFNEVDP